MSDTPRTDAGARHVSVDRAGCITLWHSKNGGYVERALSEQLERENAALRGIAAAMAEEMEQHGGEMAFHSLARYRAALAKEAKP